MSEFKLTYASMFNVPQEVHTNFEASLKKLKAEGLGKSYGMLINNKDVFTEKTYPNISPINKNWVLGHFPAGTQEHVNQAMSAAKAAFPAWSAMPWVERVKLVRKAADIMESRLYDLAAANALNTGKTRMEALGDVQECPDLLRSACDWMEKKDGYVFEQGADPLPGFTVKNVSIMKPYGVWLVISPFNFPTALTCTGSGPALVTGNTVVTKPSVETTWAVRLLSECFRDAGLPDGVFNFVTGDSDDLGKMLVDHPDVGGITFTGSQKVGMEIYRKAANRAYPHPVVLELGGKNATIVSNNADLDAAAKGIVRAAYGTAGQKCSCTSRVYAESAIYDKLVERVVELTQEIKVGDPTRQEVYVGPLINQTAHDAYLNYVKELDAAGNILTGGKAVANTAGTDGCYVAPTVVVDVPYDHEYWKKELFVPIVLMGKVDDLADAMTMTNDTTYGLTGGFYGNPEEIAWYFNNIEVGVAYANRSQGASTGAWPGYQSFGGWKGSTSVGRGSGGPYYLISYMREQSQTVVTPV